MIPSQTSTNLLFLIVAHSSARMIVPPEKAQCVKGGGGQKNVFFRENQRFVLVNWVKLLNVQPWGPHFSGGEQNYGQKTAIFGHIWQYLAIDGPSCPIWVEHRLNRVEHCISHMGGPVRPLWTHQKWSLGSQGAPKNDGLNTGLMKQWQWSVFQFLAFCRLWVKSYLLYWRRRRISGNSCNAPVVREIWMIMMFLVSFFLPLFQSNVRK